MKKYFLFFLLFLSCSAFSSTCIAFERIFYVLRYSSPDRMASSVATVESLKRHYKKIDVLIPQAYVINEKGEVEKEIEPEILDFALKHKMKIMPLVTNKKFDKNLVHQFLADVEAQNKAIDRLIALCHQYKFDGVQIDFEMVNILDKEKLTQFFQLAANKMHEKSLHISFAVAPVVTDKPNTIFLRKIYDNWEGAYDLRAIGEFADFISIMAYNQHGAGVTTPGPAASLPWVDQVTHYALQYVPKNKISLAVHDFSTHWYTAAIKTGDTEKAGVTLKALNYNDTLTLMKQNQLKSSWDKKQGISYVIFTKDWLNEYLFIEDKKSFHLKLNLVSQYQLRGVSVFDLGTEDEGIWDLL